MVICDELVMKWIEVAEAEWSEVHFVKYQIIYALFVRRGWFGCVDTFESHKYNSYRLFRTT